MSESILDLIPSEIKFIEEEALPYSAIMSVTNRCNLSCPYCFHEQSSVDMTYETADMAVKYIISNAIRVNKTPFIAFFGGEPLLRFDEVIKPLVKKYKHSIQWGITTNGTLLNNEIIDFCYEYNIDILLSIDGCKQVQDIQRPIKNQDSSFDLIKNNIPYLLLKKPNTVFRSTITKYSLPYLNESIDFAVKSGFKYITLVPNLFETWNEADRKLWESFIDNEAIKLMQCFSWEEPIPYILNNLVNGVNDLANQEKTQALINPFSRCGMGFNCIGISPEGFLHPCQEENGQHENKSIGNIYSGIDVKLHKLYCEDIKEKWINYLKNIDENQDGSNNFKLFFANSYCSTRLKDNLAYCKTQAYYLKPLHRACSVLYQHYRYTLNPMALKVFNF